MRGFLGFGLDLFRIDLNTVVNKYIGETGKNIETLLDKAEDNDVILLFDEVDALLGKRTDISDSSDRYANMGINFLLQRLEDYHGLAILFTKLKRQLDPAFQRRVRFFVEFNFA
jgi:SpoVK/Ycf46/Vps4 family AAA+-type ATPase